MPADSGSLLETIRTFSGPTARRVRVNVMHTDKIINLYFRNYYNSFLVDWSFETHYVKSLIFGQKGNFVKKIYVEFLTSLKVNPP